MSQLQFVFGNPRKKRRAPMLKRKVTRGKKNPQYIKATKGAVSKKLTPTLTTAELRKIKSVEKNLDDAIKGAKTAINTAGVTGANVSALKKKAASLDVKRKKLKTAFRKELNAFKKAARKGSALRAKGYKTKVVKVSEDEAKLLADVSKLKKKVSTLKKKASKKGGSVAKKRRKKKATRKKASRKKVTKKKKVTRKKASKKKATRKKATRKKASRKKVSRKKTTRKKASKKKASRKKSSRRKKGRKKRALKYGTFKKKLSKATRKKGGIGKGKKRSYKFKKGKRKYSASVKRYKKNPLFGGNMKLKKFLRHDVAEATGLALGGLSHGLVNDAVARFLPGLAGNIQRVLGNFSGSFFPVAGGVLLGMAADRSKGNFKNWGGQVAKGLIGAGVVGLGATGYEAVRPAIGMSGLVQQDQFAGAYNQLGEESEYTMGRRGYLDGEYEQMGALAPADFDWTSSYSEEADDFGLEFEQFEGEYDQMG